MSSVPRSPPASTSAPEADRRFFVRPPLAVLLVALFAGALHMMPTLHALAETPEGWTFTGNVSVSPDVMQYRVWMRQALEQGPVVDDRFTSEPSRPFLPVLYYWTIGQVARVLGVSPEWTNAWAGVPFAVLLTWLVYLTARYFVVQPRMTFWVLLAVMFGGGLTAHLKLLAKVPGIYSLPVVHRWIGAAYDRDAPTFEDSRFHYVLRTLFDSHFLLIWLWALAAILAFYFALRRPAAWRSVVAALLFAGLTVVHVYEGLTLLAIAISVTALCWIKGTARKPALTTFLLCALAVGPCLLWMRSLQRSCGLPFPTWSAPGFPISNILLAFPLAWGLIAIGLESFWRTGGLERCFLLGWALACTLILLSHPYYPYHDRGAVTLQIVLFVIAGSIWLQRYGVPGVRAGLVAIAALGAAPVFVTQFLWRATSFDPAEPWMFQSPADRELVERLAAASGPEDLLIAPDRDYRWLYPEFRGRSHDAHFFLTVDFERKAQEKQRFFESDSRSQAEFLRRERIRFLYVDRERDPARFAAVPGLTPLLVIERGGVFEVGRDGGESSR